MKNRLLLAAMFFAFLASFSGLARADSIGPNCGTCQGSIYTLQFLRESVSGNLSTYDIFLTINTSGYTGGGTLLDDVAFKVTAHAPTNVLLDSAVNGASNWMIVPGGIDAAGCNGHGSGFVCAGANNLSFAASVPNSTVSRWVFDITVPTGSLFLGPFQSTIKARYTDNAGNKVGALVSENITLQPIPEPGTLLLMGTGLIALARAARRRFSA